ncbi:MAG: hypothetical protein RL368_1393, partial [Pseudomonadota bacterium]
LEELISKKILRIKVTDYMSRIPSVLSEFCKLYTKELPNVFATSEDKFSTSDFNVEIDIVPYSHISDAIRGIEIVLGGSDYSVNISPDSKEDILILKVTGKKSIADYLSKEYLLGEIHFLLQTILFDQFPKPFIISSERTGAAIFRKELSFSRQRLLSEVNRNKLINPRDLLSKAYQDYPLPIKENLEFMGALDSFAKKKSFIQKEHPEILQDFADIIGGSYTLVSQDELRYTPQNYRRVKLSIDESSSAVRSLVDLGFYLKHVAEQDDLLIIDEPELNLHPENQRKIARLLTRLVNIGIKVLITTHSDYIIRELNTLIMLNQDKPHLKKIMLDEGYKSEELLSANKVKAYVAGSVVQKNRKTPYCTLTPMKVDPELGMEISSFETTLDTMNRIQESIIWGAE